MGSSWWGNHRNHSVTSNAGPGTVMISDFKVPAVATALDRCVQKQAITQCMASGHSLDQAALAACAAGFSASATTCVASQHQALNSLDLHCPAITDGWDGGALF